MTLFKNDNHQEMLDTLKSQIDIYWDRAHQLGLTELWKKSWKQYNSGFYHLGELEKKGDFEIGDELLSISINDFASILRHMHVLVTKDPPYLDARPLNSSSKAIEQALPANLLLEYYQDQHHMDAEIRIAKLYELLFGSGYLLVDWDQTAGKVIAKNEKQKGLYLREGEVQIKAYPPFHVFHPIFGKKEESEWYIVRDIKSKEEIRKHYGLRAEFDDAFLSTEFLDSDDFGGFSLPKNSDWIDVYTLYHLPTEEHREGLRLVFTNGHILEKGRLPGKKMPVIQVANQFLLSGRFGTTMAFDLLEIQKAKDSLVSTILNNQATFGLNSLIVPKSAQLEASKIIRSMQILEVEDMRQKPETLDMLKSNPEILQLIRYLEKSMERVSGINSVVRGQAHATQSGQALALITSMAIQFTSGYLRTYREVYKKAGEALLSILRFSLPIKRQLKIVGRDGKHYRGIFSRQTLEDEYDVSVELVNPLKATAQGREALATSLVQNGMISEPSEYLNVLMYGRVDDLLKKRTDIQNALKSDREALISGEKMEVREVQNHPLFIENALALLDDNLHSKDNELAESIYEYVKNRMEVWAAVSKTNPELLQIRSIPLYEEFFSKNLKEEENEKE